MEKSGLGKVSLIVERDYQGNNIYGGGGTFEEVSNISVAGSTDKTSGEEFAVAVVKAKYEIRSFTYTISFTKEMKLAGLYYK